MTRKEGKANTTTKTVRGRKYHYYRMTTTIDGRPKERLIPIKAEPGTPEYDRIYWSIRSGKFKPSVKTTFAVLVESYMRSRRFTSLAASTRRKYGSVLEEIRTKNAHVDVTAMRRSDIEAIHEKHAATTRKADGYVQVLRILFNHAIRLEWMTANPAAGIELFGPQWEHEPWPDWFRAEFLARAEGVARAAFFIGLGTGQRPGDVVKMRWEDFDGDYMRVVQEKTGERIEVYCPRRLKDFLATWPKAGRYLFAKNLTAPVTYDAMQRRFAAVRDRIAETRPEAKAFNLHGLRKLAAVELAEAGCSDAEIQSVTGHRSLKMVQHYRAAARRKTLSKSAQQRRERNGGEP